MEEVAEKGITDQSKLGRVGEDLGRVESRKDLRKISCMASKGWNDAEKCNWRNKRKKLIRWTSSNLETCAS